MFDFSFNELLVVCVAGLVILGPKELPAAVRAIRNVIRRVRHLTDSVRTQINEVLDEEEVKDVATLIKGDDGTFYETFDVSDIKDHSKVTRD